MTELPVQDLPNQSSAPWWKLRAGWIYQAITSGELHDHDARDDVRYNVSLQHLGALAVPGGQFVAADPYIMGDDQPEPFTQRFNADQVDVIAARATIEPGHERVAAAVLRAGSNPIEDWDMARVHGQDLSTLESEGFFGYGVDAGTGSFGSPAAMMTAGRVLMNDGGMLEDPVSAALFSDGIGTSSAVVVAPEAGATPIAVFSSGWGDGFYPTWLGMDSTGNVVVAVTDFLLTGDPYAAPLPADPPAVEAPEPPKKSLLQRWLRS